jgi:predicted CXXCH cytochrome family protein
MHRMTRAATGAEIAAPFDGASLHFKADTARLEQRGDKRFVKIESPRGSSLWLLTKVLGGHHREDFVGAAVTSYDAAPAGDEQVLPVSFVRASGTLRYKGYSVMLHERPFLAAGPSWSKTCIFCHNTAPYFSSLLGALAGRGARRYQGAIVDANLPRDRAWKYEVADRDALGAATADELSALKASGPASLAQLIEATRDRFGGAELVELGIGCESCHGGMRAHANDPRIKPSYAPRAPFLRIKPEPTDAQSKTRVCARCHQVLFSKYPWTWEGGRRNADAGGSHISSGEARDFLLGGCASAMTCTACHDPHATDSSAKMREVDSLAGNAICLRCHQKYSGDDALRAHAHHDPRGEAGVCIRCHMPRKNMTLDSTLGRYHRIGSPTDPIRVLRDRPLECALCHADMSTESLISTMEKWWNKRYDRDLLRALYNDLSRPNLLPTLASGKPHEQAVALATIGNRRDAIALIAKQTLNEYPLVREYARAALERALNKPCAIDLGADAGTIERAAKACLSAAHIEAPEPWTAPQPDNDSDPGED